MSDNNCNLLSEHKNNTFIEQKREPVNGVGRIRWACEGVGVVEAID